MARNQTVNGNLVSWTRVGAGILADQMHVAGLLASEAGAGERKQAIGQTGEHKQATSQADERKQTAGPAEERKADVGATSLKRGREDATVPEPVKRPKLTGEFGAGSTAAGSAAAMDESE